MDEKRLRSWTLLLTGIASFMVALDTLVVTTALNAIRLKLGASISALGWMVTAYTLSFAVLIMLGSALGERFGRRRVFASGLTLFTLASAACALAPGANALIAARVVQGVGAAFVMPLALALLSSAFPKEQRAKALGLFASITGLAILSGPVVGGAVVQGISWQWIFWINVPVGIIVTPLILTKLRESDKTELKLDFVGIALMTVGIFGITWGLIRSSSLGWGNVEITGALIAGLLTLIAFALWELHVAQPMLQIRLFRLRAFSAGNTATFFLYSSMFGALFFVAQFLQTAEHYDPLGAGLRLLPWTATLFFIGPIAGTLIKRVGERSLLVSGLTMQAIGMGSIALLAPHHPSYLMLIIPLTIAGAGVSLAVPASQHAVVSAVEPPQIGQASGVYSVLRQLGGVFGVAVVVAVFAQMGSYGSLQLFSDGFAAAIGASAGLSLLGAIAGLLLPGYAHEA
ncbi:MAG TPA: MFS transporter [Candidatus Saccharimonadales bacterium]|nr:MFS transporter [Candidatus Saccharimonadales bacterium]